MKQIFFSFLLILFINVSLIAQDKSANSISQKPSSHIEKIMSDGEPCPGFPAVTYEGKVYNTVMIGSQCWLKENLDVGIIINSTVEMTDNSTIEKYCNDNDPNNCEIYGGSYQWNEAMQYSTASGVQGICPSGWHIPTRTELETLIATVNGDGNSLLEIGQGGGTNSSGFSALLAGAYAIWWSYPGGLTFFWSSTQNNIGAYSMTMTSDNSNIIIDYCNRVYGFSVRCLYDDLVPVEIERFGIEINGNDINLNWATATEINNRGFEIERSKDAKKFHSIGFVNGAGTTTEKTTYQFCDENPINGISYYRLKQIDYDGSFEYSRTVEVNYEKQLGFSLSQNYPNPFNPTTTIKYSIPEQCYVTIKIFDVLGNKITTIVAEEKQVGVYDVVFDASNIPSGVYFYKLESVNYSASKKFMILK